MLLPGSAYADTIDIQVGSPDDLAAFLVEAEAVNAQGDIYRLTLAPGTYVIDEDFSYDVELAGVQGDPSAVVLTRDSSPVRGRNFSDVRLEWLTIDGENAHPALALLDDAEFTIDNAVLRDGSSQGDGGTIRLYEASSLTLSNSTVSGGTSGGRGGNVLVNGANASMVAQNTLFDGGVAATVGGNLYVGLGSLTLDDCDVRNGSAVDGAGVGVDGSGNLVVTGGSFSGNVATDDGGGAELAGSGTVNISDATFTDNTAPRGGGVFARMDVELVGVLFEMNHATVSGGGLYVGGLPDLVVTIRGGRFDRNTADNEGAGLYADNGILTLQGSDFVDNTADNYGAGVRLHHGDATLANNLFCRNIAGLDGGALHLTSGTRDLTNSVLIENQAGNSGGAITLWDAELYRGRNNTFVANRASGNGSAILGGPDTDGEESDSILTLQTGSNTVLHNTGRIVSSVLWDNTGTLQWTQQTMLPAADPMFASWVPGDCSRESVWLTAGSSLIDQGELVDPDGTPSDVGAFGGPASDNGPFADDDGDGVVAYLDCDPADADVADPFPIYADDDGDGFGAGPASSSCVVPDGFATVDGDCDDLDPSRNPGTVWFADADGDGFGDATDTVTACVQPAGTVSKGSDCDDSDAAVGGPIDAWSDADGDGYGSDATTLTACPGAPGVVFVSGDCDDTDPDRNPETVWYLDLDGDGAGGSSTVAQCPQPMNGVVDSTDCNDADAAVSPDATEQCNGRDDDCDGDVDDDDDDVVFVVGTPSYFSDGDGDGYGTGAAVVMCALSSGFAASSGDCDDTDPETYPGAFELCDGVDNDCDPATPDSQMLQSWYVDGDGDGFGAGPATSSCSAPGVDYVLNADDCLDTDGSVSPDGEESCNGLDDDCDGTVDVDPVVGDVQYLDDDGDGYGTGPAVVACGIAAGFAADNGDCDDSDASRSPGAVEICDGIDQDCDTVIDDGAPGTMPWYGDGDGDGYGTSQLTLSACNQPTGYVQAPGDCDDLRADVNPGEIEQCDDVDHDCDGAVDNDVQNFTLYEDLDGDGFGAGSPVFDCVFDGRVLIDGDCDDTTAEVNPDAEEVWYDGVDQDCDGNDDDRDGDGAGIDLDCDDDDVLIGPAVAEIWYDGIDQNCDGNDDDQDGDGVPVPDDCNDLDASVSPETPEVLDNGIDEDCDGADKGAPQVRGACGCDAGSSGSGPVWMGLFAGLLALRRRSFLRAFRGAPFS